MILRSYHGWGFDADCRDQTAAFGAPVLSLQGGGDPILSLAMRGMTFASAWQVELEEHSRAGHLLPLTDSEFCAGRIANFAERLR